MTSGPSRAPDASISDPQVSIRKTMIQNTVSDSFGCQKLVSSTFTITKRKRVSFGFQPDAATHVVKLTGIHSLALRACLKTATSRRARWVRGAFIACGMMLPVTDSEMGSVGRPVIDRRGTADRTIQSLPRAVCFAAASGSA